MRMKISWIIILIFICRDSDSDAWTASSSYAYDCRLKINNSAILFAGNSDFSFSTSSRENSLNNVNWKQGASTVKKRQRVQVAGVSVSSTGFHVILTVNSSHYLPLQVTDDRMDHTCATSPQALTILQLLAKVDMAGAILPPDLLARIVVLSLEQQAHLFYDDDDSHTPPNMTFHLSQEGELVLKMVKESLKKLEYTNATNATTYSELLEYPWLQSRIALPIVTLDELILTLDGSFRAVCSAKNLPVGSSSLLVDLTEFVIEQVSYQYRPESVSMAFLALALAFRYHAPIELVTLETIHDSTNVCQSIIPSALMTLDEIRDKFPLYRTAQQLQQTAERVTTNIETSLEVNQLQAAFRLALKKEDYAAASKIRAALDKMDSIAMNELPTQSETDTDRMQ